MLTSAQLKLITSEARPIIERMLDDAERLAGMRDVVAAAGGDWSQLKALIKAQIKDENDDAGDGKHVRKILDKAEYATAYADMLGLGGSNMNEKNSFAGVENLDPHLLNMLVQGSQTEAGRSIIFAALKAVQDGDTDFDPSTGEVEPPMSHASVQPGREEPGTTGGAASTGETASNSEAASELVAHGMEAADHGSVATNGAAAPQATNPGGENVARTPAHAPEQPGQDYGSVRTPAEGGANSAAIHEPEAAMLPQTGRLQHASYHAAERVAVESSAAHSPERATEEGGGFPVAAAPHESGATGGDEGDQTSQPVNVGGTSGVTAGETAPHSLPAAPVAPRRLPGDTWTEHTPPEPLRWHEYARCFPEHWAMSLANIKDGIREEGVREPIVRIGNEILDGRARYNCARELLIDYPVKEYDGTDPLLDMIRWNLEARQMGANERKLVATKLAKLCPDRGEEIAAAFGLDHGRAAAE